MNTAVAAFARVALFLCAGIAGGALAQSNTQANSDSQCVKTRCFTPSCYHQYAGGYYMRCPDGNHPLPKSEQTVPTEGDRQNDSTAPSSSPGSGQTHPSNGAAAIQDVGGDWEFRLGASPKPMAVLRLRLGSTGSLEGTLEQSLGATLNRVSLQDVTVSDSTITYATPGGKIFHGTLSGDHLTIVGEAGSPSWSRTRSLAQALAEDAKSH